MLTCSGGAAPAAGAAPRRPWRPTWVPGGGWSPLSATATSPDADGAVTVYVTGCRTEITTVVPPASGVTCTVLTRSSETSMAAGLLVSSPRRKSVISSRNVSPVLAGPCPPAAGFAPTVRSSMTVPGVARTVTSVFGSGAGLDSTRTSAGSGSTASAMRHESRTTPIAPTPPPAPARAVIGAVSTSLSPPVPGLEQSRARCKRRVGLTGEEERSCDEHGVAGRGAFEGESHGGSGIDDGVHRDAAAHRGRESAGIETAAPHTGDDHLARARQEMLQHRRPRLVRHHREHQHQAARSDEARQLGGERRHAGGVVRTVDHDEGGLAQHGEPTRPADASETHAHRGCTRREPRAEPGEQEEGNLRVAELERTLERESEPILGSPARGAKCQPVRGLLEGTVRSRSH